MNFLSPTRVLCGALLCLMLGLKIQAQNPSNQAPPLKDLEGTNPALRLNTNLVTLNVSVLDQDGNPIVGLNRQRFDVYEDGVKQSLEFFSTTDSPASVGVIFDRSSSMQFLLPRSRQAFESFVQSSHPADEYFLIAFDKKPELVLERANGETLLRRVTQERASGDTSLYDAILMGLKNLEQAKYPKRTLLIFSDGVDTSSRTSYSELLKAVKEADCQIFFVGSGDIQSAGCGRFCQMQTFNRMHDLATITGGQAFFLMRPQAVEHTITQIALLLRQQYSLGYLPNNEPRKGKWRKIDVKVTLSEIKARVLARKGYFDRLEANSE